MEIIKIDPSSINQEKIQLIVQTLKQGRVCVLPTDTSYGLCARADQKDATDKVYQLKRRVKDKSLSVFVKDMKMIDIISALNEKNKKILKNYLPGSYTFIINKKQNILDNISADKNTIGIRWISSVLLEDIFRHIDFPVTATSANISNQAPIYNPKEIINLFKDKGMVPDLLVDAGKLKEINPSTVVDLSSKTPIVLRQGKENFNYAGY